MAAVGEKRFCMLVILLGHKAALAGPIEEALLAFLLLQQLFDLIVVAFIDVVFAMGRAQLALP